MRFLSALLLSLLAGLASSVQVPGLPKCAGDCLPNDNFGGCGQLKVACICSNKPFLAGLACCVSINCDASDQEKTIQFAKSFCAAEGHVSDLPTTATCAPGQASSYSSTASTATSTGSTTGTASAASTPTTSSGVGNMLRMGECGVGVGLLMAGLAAL